MYVGHLRSTIIGDGDTVARMLELSFHASDFFAEIIYVHVGDCMMGCYFKKFR